VVRVRVRVRWLWLGLGLGVRVRVRVSWLRFGGFGVEEARLQALLALKEKV
jgi:hypothetical protein